VTPEKHNREGLGSWLAMGVGSGGPRDALVIEALRTPIGRYGGALSRVRPDDLASYVIQALVERSGINPECIDDVIFGCGNQAGEDNRNVARMAVLLAGLPPTVPGVTVNRLCASGLDAINYAAYRILSGESDVIIAGGVESMSRAPFVMPKPEHGFPRGDIRMYDTTIGWRFVNPRLASRYRTLSMGECAEVLAEKYNISREEQDRYALESHRRAIRAIDEHIFDDEIIPVKTVDEKGEERVVRTDEGPRRDTDMEKMARLRPVFKENGTVTAGNSSQISDGAAGVLLVSREKAEELGLTPLARFVSSAVAAVHPDYMGLGPVYSTPKALKRAGLTLDDIGLIELNEAFAAQVLACMREMPLESSRVNPNGGAIALGHPIGCSGARIVATLLHEMRRRKVRYGLATLCVGVGQGESTVFELVA